MLMRHNNSYNIFCFYLKPNRKHELNINFGMKDDENIEWKNGTINVIELNEATHSININCTQDQFTLTIEGLERGKTELGIGNVTKLDACAPQTTVSDTTTTISTIPSTSTSTTVAKANEMK